MDVDADAGRNCRQFQKTVTSPRAGASWAQKTILNFLLHIKLETVSIAEPLQNRQHAQNP